MHPHDALQWRLHHHYRWQPRHLDYVPTEIGICRATHAWIQLSNHQQRLYNDIFRLTSDFGDDEGVDSENRRISADRISRCGIWICGTVPVGSRTAVSVDQLILSLSCNITVVVFDILIFYTCCTIGENRWHYTTASKRHSVTIVLGWEKGEHVRIFRLGMHVYSAIIYRYFDPAEYLSCWIKPSIKCAPPHKKTIAFSTTWRLVTTHLLFLSIFGID